MSLIKQSILFDRENAMRSVRVSPTDSLTVNTTTRLVGTNFDGTVKDTNFWTEAVTGSGAAAQDGEIELTTGTTANSTASYTSIDSARFVVGSALQFIGAFRFVTAGTVDNVRRCGAYDANEGFFFELDGTTFSVGSRKGGVDTLVSSGSFNGNMGASLTVNSAVYYKLDIEWTPLGAFYYVNGNLLHQSVGGHLTGKLTLPITFENVNDNGNITPVTFDCLGVVILREGNIHTAPTYQYIAGAATNTIKVGAGELHTIVNNDNSGSVTVYDGLDAAGTVIASIDLAKVLGTLDFHASFNVGLTFVTVGAGVKITVVYE